jgi:hypothetical protein
VQREIISKLGKILILFFNHKNSLWAWACNIYFSCFYSF